MPQTLIDWVRQLKVDAGMRDGVSSDDRFFCPGGAQPPIKVLRSFVDKNRDTCEVARCAQGAGHPLDRVKRQLLEARKGSAVQQSPMKNQSAGRAQNKFLRRAASVLL